MVRGYCTTGYPNKALHFLHTGMQRINGQTSEYDDMQIPAGQNRLPRADYRAYSDLLYAFARIEPPQLGMERAQVSTVTQNAVTMITKFIQCRSCANTGLARLSQLRPPGFRP